jgi:FtsZ-binding cell division protein ZapB
MIGAVVDIMLSLLLAAILLEQIWNCFRPRRRLNNNGGDDSDDEYPWFSFVVRLINFASRVTQALKNILERLIVGERLVLLQNEVNTLRRENRLIRDRSISANARVSALEKEGKQMKQQLKLLKSGEKKQMAEIAKQSVTNPNVRGGSEFRTFG